MPPTIRPWPLTRKGGKDFPVRSLQHLLNGHASAIKVDGVCGDKTDEAVRALQKAEELGVDGIVGPKTWPKLIVLVRKGSEGDAVRALQDAFKARADEPREDLKVDGIFGDKTETAVRGFQEALEARVDGIAGPVTWQALMSGTLLD